MLYKLIEWDKELFLFLNSKHIGWLDPVMLVLSSYPCWIVVCLTMVAIIYFRGRERDLLATVFFLVSTGCSALLTNLVKFVIGRPRPIHNTDWGDTIHAIEKYSTSSSFFSSHSATTFTMAVFFFLFFRSNKLFGWIAILWAATVAYSRIYLAKHYPFDVFCGIVFGSLIGILGYKLYEYYKKKNEKLEA